MLTEPPSVTIDRSLALVEGWLTTYVTKPHAEIGRAGAVCPFVEPARRAESLEVRVRLVGPAPNAALMNEVVRCGLDEFIAMSWRGNNPALHALLVLLPDLPVHALGLLDQAHAEVKSESVRRGLMIGQFHEKCAEVAARNPLFPVSRSPVPLVAVRSMAIHDVFFLAGEEEWFTVYAGKFGARFWGRSRTVDSVLASLFHDACAKYGIGPGPIS